jgi:lipoic acid synthetase
VLDPALAVFPHNIDTVRRLTHPVRDPRAGYDKTIAVLEHAKKHNGDILTKSSLMLGLGERDHEIMEVMDDLRQADVDILTLGQYLRPTPNHLAVERYVAPDEFEAYRREGLEKGFLEVVAGPLVRSSYRADRVLQKNNVGIAV